MKTDLPTAALDRATPARLWVYAAFIAVLGIALRVIWFVQFEHDLPFGIDTTYTGHFWPGDPFRGDVAPSSYAAQDLTRAFAPAYGGLLRGLSQLASGPHEFSVDLLIVQSGLIALATLITFALARRVLFGYAALAPPVLVTASIALIELPGGLAPQIPLMFLVVLAIWQTMILRERLPETTGPKTVLLTISTGFTFGLAILFNPAVLLLAPLVIWWAFRGLGADHATLLLVAVVLLPASWLAIIQTNTSAGIPTADAKAWINKDAGNLPATAEEVGNRAYWIATPWDERFARGSYASANWNYESILPKSVRTDSNYQSATRGLAEFFMVFFAVLIVLGLAELFAEGAGSGARLLAFPVIALPLTTFLSDNGNVLRIPMLPFMLIALTLGWIWLIENLKPYVRERRAEHRPEWTEV